MLRSVLRVASPSGRNGRLSILILHRVLPVPDPLFPAEVDARHFDEICGWAKSLFTVLPLDEAVRCLRAGTLPDRALAITFDDGYADNHGIALPILLRHGLPATFFVATGFLDGGRMWNDTVIESVRQTTHTALDLRDLPGADLGQHALGSLAERRVAIGTILRGAMHLAPGTREDLVDALARRAGARLPTDLMMRSAQVRQLHQAGMQIGAHTVTHPILANLDAASAAREIAESRRFLEDLLGVRVGLFAYPSGRPGRDYSAESVQVARAQGFDAAVTTAWGAAGRASDLHQLPRFTPWDRSRLRFAARMINNLWTSPAGSTVPDRQPVSA